MKRAGKTDKEMGRELLDAPIGPGGKHSASARLRTFDEMIKGLKGTITATGDPS